MSALLAYSEGTSPATAKRAIQATSMNDLADQENQAPDPAEARAARDAWPGDERPPMDASSEGSAFGGLGPLIACAAIFNLLALPLTRGLFELGPRLIMILAPIIPGILAGQIGVLALWLVWGRGSFVRRLAMHWLIMLGLFLTFAIGLVIATAEPDGDPGDMIIEVLQMVVCSLPLACLAAQLPLWPLRTHFGWRVDRTNTDQPDQPPQPLAIRDLLLATVITSVSLACIRLTPLENRELDATFWLGWCVGGLSIAGLSTISLLPVLVITLRCQDASSAVAWLCGYVALAVVVVLAALAASFGRLLPAEALWFLGILTASYTAVLGIPLLIVRARGYRLTFPRDRKGGSRKRPPLE
jgi:hypothetical protein